MVVCYTKSAFSSDWQQWQGLNRNDITDESSGWKNAWNIHKLWDKNVGKGCSSPIIVDKKLYVMGWQGEGDVMQNPIGADTIYCFDALSGKELWKQSYPCRYHSRLKAGDEEHYGGVSSTPTIDLETNFLYTLSTDGDFKCLDTKQNGKIVWEKNLHDDYDIPQRPNVGGGTRDYGFTSSPLILGESVIVEVGAKEGTVIAFDKKTGKQQWVSSCTEPAGHTGGLVVINIQGVNCIADLTLRKLVIMRTDKGHEGQTIGEYDWQTEYSNNIPTPAVFENNIIITSNHNISKTAMLEVSLDRIKEKWATRENAQVSSPVVYKGNVYLADGNFKCIDLATGQLKWKGKNFDHGSCFATSDDKIIAFGKGNLVLIDALPDDNKYNELSRIEGIVSGICYPHVILSDGIICCKDKDGNMVVFSLKE